MTILSPHESISRIWWQKVKKGQKLKAKAVVIVPKGDGNHDLMIAQLENGGYVCSFDISKAAYLPGSWPWMDPVIKALVALGAITKDVGEAHLQLCRDRAKAKELEYAADHLKSLLRDNGLAPSPEQQAFIDANCR